MDLNTVEAIVRPTRRSELPRFESGDAWLAGGTWLLSEPQRHLRRLIDLSTLDWPAIDVTSTGMTIGATCPIAALEAFEAPSAWRAGPLFQQCCHAFWASFKIWNTATVGGNLGLALPAGPMISLSVALDATCVVWTQDGGERHVSAADFVSGPEQTILAPGELLRRLEVPALALRRRTAFRQTSLTPLGRSAALVIGTLDDVGSFRLIVTAATPRPIVLSFTRLPASGTLRHALDHAVPTAQYFDDVHGAPDWRQHLTREFAEEIRMELAT